jgi:tetratricopeptide (TPR) repeat protein
MLRSAGFGALVMLATVAAYLPALSGGFIWNDSDYVTAPALRPLHGLARIWGEPGATEQYYPLLHTAFWVQHRLFGDHPAGYHAVTLLLHAVSAVLFALVLGKLLGRGPARLAGAEWLAALLFALHPVHAESVAWIAEQKNTFSLAFYLSAALAYLRFDETRRPGPYLWAAALFALSLLCKTVTATLPAALLVVLWWRRGRLGWRRDFLPLAPWLAMGAVSGLFTSWVERAYVGAQGADFDLAWTGRVLVAGRAVCFYAAKLVWPVGLSFVYPRWIIDAGVWWQWLFPAGVLAVGALLWALRKRDRGPLAAYLLFVGSLFPTLGFVNLYGARYSWVWDHWQYLADLSPLALAAAGLVMAWRRAGPLPRWLGPGLAAAVAAVLGALTWSRCGAFTDVETLWRTTIARNPTCSMAYNNLAAEMLKDGRLDEAMADVRMALRYGPENAAAYATLGSAMARLGRTDEACAQFERALEIEPNNVLVLTNLGSVLLQAGRVGEAMGRFSRALALMPGLAKANAGLGDALLQSGRIDDAVTSFRKALMYDPEDVSVLANLGAALAQKGQLEEAIASFQRAIEIDPRFAVARIDLGNALQQRGRSDAAISQFTEALALAPSSSAAHNGLGFAYLASGRTGQAIEQFQMALASDPGNAAARKNLEDALRRR